MANMTNMTNMTEDELVQRARKRVGMKMGFYIHLLVYVLVNTGLGVLSTLRGGEHWPLVPLLGWGLGLAIHGIVVFIGLRGDGLRDRMVADEVKRLRERQ